MTLNEYQAAAQEVSTWAPGGEKPLPYYALKLNGEAGEVAELVGKAWRGDYGYEGFDDGNPFAVAGIIERNPALRDKLIRELGDVLWYVQKIAHQIGVTMDEVGETNIAKLRARVERKAAGLDPKAGEGR